MQGGVETGACCHRVAEGEVEWVCGGRRVCCEVCVQERRGDGAAHEILLRFEDSPPGFNLLGKQGVLSMLERDE